jgi:hypothetical protein
LQDKHRGDEQGRGFCRPDLHQRAPERSSSGQGGLYRNGSTTDTWHQVAVGGEDHQDDEVVEEFSGV